MTSSTVDRLSAQRGFFVRQGFVIGIALWLTFSASPGWSQDSDADEVRTSDADGAASPVAVTASDVRKVLRKLESDELQARDAAEKQLVAMGAPVLPFLPEITSRTSGEMTIRLQRIRKALESSDVETFFEASTIKLSGTFAVSEALEQITEQTGNVINLQAQDAMDGVEVELDADDQPFWEVMNTVMTQANLRINSFGSTEPELTLVPGGSPLSDEATFVSGPFRVQPSSVQTTMPFGGQAPGQLGLSLQVTWEPRLQPVFMQIPMANLEAELADEETLQATVPGAAPEIPLNYGGCTTQVDLQLERPDRESQNIERLSGEFVIAVPSARHEYQFKKFGNGARQTEKYGDVRVTLEGARRNGAVYEMRVLVEFGNAQGALESFRGWILSNQAYLLDPNDRRVENVGYQTYAVTQNAVGIAYLFQINGDPNEFTLVYESPGSVTKQTVNYELRNIPLP